MGYVIILQQNNKGYKERQLHSSLFIDGPTFPAPVSLSWQDQYMETNRICPSERKKERKKQGHKTTSDQK